MSAVIMRVSWNSNHDVLLRACLWCAVMVAVMVATPLIVAAVTPFVVVCCSAAVAIAPKVAIVLAVFYSAWMVKP